MSYTVAEERMQNYIDELEQENRLLRARNTRLEAEANAAPTVQEHLPIAMKTHGAWDGLELLDDLPDGALLYTTPPAQPAPVQPVAWLIPGSITTDPELAKANGDKAVALGKISTQQWNPEDHYKDGWRDALESVKRATPPAAPVLEGRDWSLLEATQESLREHMAEIKRLKEAQPAGPLTDGDCTRIYNEANGITTKNPPITTQRIFAAMRAAHGITEKGQP
jgi:hypothetical protein